MNIDSFTKLSKSNVEYLVEPVSELVFDGNYLSVKDGSYEDIELTNTVKESICRMVGVSPSLSNSLYDIDKELWSTVLTRLYSYHNKDNLVILVSELEDGKYKTKGLCNTSRETIPSFRFINKVLNYFNDNQSITVSDITFSNDSNLANVILLLNEDFISFNNESYKLGFVIYNDEFYNSYCRSVLYKDSLYYYLPSKCYNLSSSRYDRVTETAEESLDIMLLRISDDIDTKVLDNLVESVNYKIDSLSKLQYSYQEYTDLCTIIVNACTKSCVGNINDVTDLLDSINDFITLYGELKNEYLWKCTAFSNNTFSKFLNILTYVETSCAILPEDITPVREYLGQLLWFSKMKEVVANGRVLL